MIYTVTLNPAIDYVMKPKEFCQGKINRSVAESVHFGGKGINVSTVLGELSVPSVATGFIGGFTGQALINGIKTEYIKTDFVNIEGLTRINVKLRHGTETDINSAGPQVSESEIAQLILKLGSAQDGDIIVLSGSLPKGVGKTVYADIMESLKHKNIKFVVDAEGELLTETLKFNPFLIKPNTDELGAVFGVEIQSVEECFLYAEKLQDLGAENVLVSMGKDGAVLIDSDGNKYAKKSAVGKAVNTVGAGDSMLAGFVAGYLQKGDFDYALTLGTAAGSATAFSEGLADRRSILKVLDTLK